MDSIERLQEACKDVMRDLREVELKRANANNDIGSASAKLNLLNTDIKVLEEKYENLQSQVKEEKKKEIQDIEDKAREIANLKAQLETEVAQVRVKSSQTDQLNEDIARQISDYQNRVKELAEKDRVISEKLKQIEEFQNRLRI